VVFLPFAKSKGRGMSLLFPFTPKEERKGAGRATFQLACGEERTPGRSREIGERHICFWIYPKRIGKVEKNIHCASE